MRKTKRSLAGSARFQSAAEARYSRISLSPAAFDNWT
jgi:hypothetical protein